MGKTCRFVICIPLLILAGGCATSRPPTPFLSPSQSEPPSVEEAESPVREFPDFTAVIVQPGDTFASLAGQYLGDASRDWMISEFNDLDALTPGQGVVVPRWDYVGGGVTAKGYRMVPVLTYHKFTHNGTTDAMTVSRDAFEEQMRYLKTNGYRVIGLDELYDFLEIGKGIPDRAVVITIDDGWLSTYEIAFPILKKYGFRATLFVYTDFIGSGGQGLSWDRVTEMSRNGVDIECHSKSHRYLGRRESRESLRDYFESVTMELSESARIIEKRLNKDVRYLAYPYGDTNPLVVAALPKSGYRGALTVERGSAPSFAEPFRVGRAMIYGTYDLKDFARNLTTFREFDGLSGSSPTP